jgi:hypothetical protein
MEAAAHGFLEGGVLLLSQDAGKGLPEGSFWASPSQEREKYP